MPGYPTGQTRGMEIILRLTAPPAVCLEGTVTRGGSATSLPFSGVVELLARIEQLTDDDPQPTTQ